MGRTFEHRECFFEDTVKTILSIMEISIGCSYCREELDELTEDVRILNLRMKQYLENPCDRERESKEKGEKEQIQFVCCLLSEIQWTLSELWDLQTKLFQTLQPKDN